MTQQPYTSAYYSAHEQRALVSARAIVPLVLKVVKARSVIDIGCGQGIWLVAFREAGIEDCWGVDGDYVDRQQLKIPADRFLPRDLSQPLALDRKFDLVVSLEVAEHLKKEAADTFIASLVSAGPIVLFSAAAPFQGGVDHFNEQWPGYWAERFAKHGYLPVDFIRRRVWNRPDIAWWYAQNTFLYVERSVLPQYPLLQQEHAASPAALPLVHPQSFMNWVNWCLSLAQPKDKLPSN